MAYDRLDWHYESTEELNLPEENGGTHIGMYLAWAITRDLVGEFHVNESEEALQNLRNRKITGREFFIDQCDSKFWNDDLNDKGNKFTEYYYVDMYFNDYIATLCNDLESEYMVEDSWENFDKIALMLDGVYKKFIENELELPKKGISSIQKPWWKFW